LKLKVVQTDFEPAEYSTFAVTARKKGLTIKEALREAAVRWSRIELGMSLRDPIFHAKHRNRRGDAENHLL
jgi:hypothetical protein